MSSINIMIKPASGSCNMVCSYCFYHDITENREVKSYGMMSHDTLKHIVIKMLSQADDRCLFSFQGGEPTLIGLDFYNELIKLEKTYNTKNIIIQNSIQTNGINIDEKWAAFFAENNFFVGLSIDGTKIIHDSFRKDRHGAGTYDRLVQCTEILNDFGVEYNILTTVTQQVAEQISTIYEHYKSNGWLYMQFIPCLDPLGENRGGNEFSLTVKGFEYFLKTLFDLWYNDAIKGQYIYIRYFENILGMLLGFPPESCGVSGVCSPQMIAEADGSIYPCDFYVLDHLRIGNINTDSFSDLEACREKTGFIEQSKKVEPECKQCDYFKLCRGGCRRDREVFGQMSLNFYCTAYKEFFAYSYERFIKLAEISVNNHMNQKTEQIKSYESR